MNEAYESERSSRSSPEKAIVDFDHEVGTVDFGIDSGPPPAQDAPPAQDDPITDFLEGDTLDPAQKREFLDILHFGKKEELAFTMSES